MNPLVAQKNNYSYVSDRHKNDGSSIFEDASEKSVETELYSSHGSRPFHIVSLSRRRRKIQWIRQQHKLEREKRKPRTERLIVGFDCIQIGFLWLIRIICAVDAQYSCFVLLIRANIYCYTAH